MRALLARGSAVLCAGALIYAEGRRRRSSLAAEDSAPQFQKSMYIWGNGHYQARPDSRTAYNNFTPKKITHSYARGKGEAGLTDAVPLLSTAVFNETHGVGIGERGDLLAFDAFALPNDLSREQGYFLQCKGVRVPRHSVLANVTDLGLGKAAAKVALTAQFVWALTAKGELFRLPAEALRRESFSRREWKRAEQPGRLRDIAAGDNHLLMLSEAGEVWAVGEDTLGQCGQGDRGRSAAGPFPAAFEEKPRRVDALKSAKVTRIWAGNSHNFAQTSSGDLYGFGSNSHMQLAHELEYSAVKDPLLALFAPHSFTKYLEEARCDLKAVALGADFSLFVCKNRSAGFGEVWGCGAALRGQIPLGFSRHLANFIKVDNLSEFTVRDGRGVEVDVHPELLTCGRAHCMSLLSNGMMMIWGDNEFGQIGNKKRSFVDTPLIITPLKHANVLAARASHNSNFVLVEEPLAPAAAAPA